MGTVRWLGAMLLLGVMACQQAETPAQRDARVQQETTAFTSFLETGVATYARLADAGKADSVAAMYTEQATYMPPNERPLTGRQAIQQRYRTQAGWGQWSRSITTTGSWANGDLAVARGRAVLKFTPGRNAPRGMTAMTDTAKWVARYQRVDDQWLLADLIWNSNRPMPQPAAAAPARRR